MNKEELMLLVEGKVLKVGKNQIYIDEEYFVVEKFEYTTESGVDMFSIDDGYRLLEDALNQAKILLPDLV